jgi:hypothetical protein
MICSVLPLEVLDSLSRCSVDVATLLAAVGGLVSESPTAAVLQLSRHCSSSSGPKVLVHHTSHRCIKTVQLSSINTSVQCCLPWLSWPAYALLHLMLLPYVVRADGRIVLQGAAAGTAISCRLPTVISFAFSALYSSTPAACSPIVADVGQRECSAGSAK